MLLSNQKAQKYTEYWSAETETESPLTNLNVFL